MAIVSQRGLDIARVERLAEKPWNRRSLRSRDDGAEQLLLAAEMGIDGGLRDAGLARDRVHADRAKAGGEKGALGGGEDRFRLAAGLLARAPARSCMSSLHARALTASGGTFIVQQTRLN